MRSMVAGDRGLEAPYSTHLTSDMLSSPRGCAFTSRAHRRCEMAKQRLPQRLPQIKVPPMEGAEPARRASMLRVTRRVPGGRRTEGIVPGRRAGNDG